MQSLSKLSHKVAVSAMPRLFGLKKATKRNSKSKRNLGHFSSVSTRGPRKILKVERPGWRDKFRRGDAPMSKAITAMIGFYAVIGVYGLILGDAFSKVSDSIVGSLASTAQSAGFGITEVRVAGGSRLTSDEVTGLLGLQKNASALTLNVNAARERFLDIPWIQSASVRLLMPGTLEVTLIERAPYALWQRAGKVMMLDKEGRKIGAYTDVRFSALPLVVGTGADEQAVALLGELSNYPALQSRLRAAIYVGSRRWNLKFNDGIDVKLPEHNFKAALATLSGLDKDNALLNRDISIVDLRLPDRVIVRMTEGAARDRLDMLKMKAGSYNKPAPVEAPKPQGNPA
ncbi:MAG: cell division protein FtsQ/DivIB [Pseudomonadota bacterium]